MATIPLYDTTVTEPGAWRHVTAPGGYQWWRVDAIDRPSGAVIVIVFHDGCMRDREYATAFRKFQTWPTKTPPPQPGDFRAVELGLYELNRRARVELISIEASRFSASVDRLAVNAGGHNLLPNEDGYTLAGPGIQLQMKPTGTDGSLWAITGTFLTLESLDAYGALRVDFGNRPDHSRFRFTALLSDRAISGTATDESDLMTSWNVQHARRLENGRTLYRSDDERTAVIADRPVLLRI